MRRHHIATVNPTLPLRLLDNLLSALEATLCEAGATHVWLDPELPPLAVMAAFPIVQ